MLEEEGMSVAPPQHTQFVTASQAPPPISGSQRHLKNRVEADIGKSESESDEDGGGDKEENGGNKEQDGYKEQDHNDHSNDRNDNKSHQEAAKQTGYIFPSFPPPYFCRRCPHLVSRLFLSFFLSFFLLFILVPTPPLEGFFFFSGILRWHCLPLLSRGVFFYIDLAPYLPSPIHPSSLTLPTPHFEGWFFFCWSGTLLPSILPTSTMPTPHLKGWVFL